MLLCIAPLVAASNVPVVLDDPVRRGLTSDTAAPELHELLRACPDGVLDVYPVD